MLLLRVLFIDSCSALLYCSPAQRRVDEREHTLQRVLDEALEMRGAEPTFDASTGSGFTDSRTQPGGCVILSFL